MSREQSRKIPSAVRTATLRIPGSKMRVQCRIYETQRDMHRAIRNDVVGGIENSTMACCVHQTLTTIDDSSIAAVIFFSRAHLDHGTVAHEMVHAAMNVLERRRQEPKEHEERLATVVGELVNAFEKHARV